MTSPDESSPLRPWQDIARELAQQTNREKIAELAEELNRALEEQQGLDRTIIPPRDEADSPHSELQNFASKLIPQKPE
jgi:16S rRNA U1498 N3-methylase RsmE